MTWTPKWPLPAPPWPPTPVKPNGPPTAPPSAANSSASMNFSRLPAAECISPAGGTHQNGRAGLALPAAQSASTTDPRGANHDQQDPRRHVLVWFTHVRLELLSGRHRGVTCLWEGVRK